MIEAVRWAGGRAVGRAVGGVGAGSVACALALLTALPPYGLTAQTIGVVVTPSFRPTAVVAPHVRYLAARDTALGGLVIGELTVGPVTIAGSVRVEGAAPLAREPEPRAYDDSVRFEPDGRVVFVVADGEGRPPINVEVVGSRGAAGGRIVITARSWPVNRVLLVTVDPADQHEYRWRVAGFGERDRITVDDQANAVYLTDATLGGSTTVFALGRGAQGRLQSDATTILVPLEGGVERRTVGKVTLIVQPTRAATGSIHAEIMFGVGTDAAEALRQAVAAGQEPVPVRQAPRLRVETPASEVSLLLTHLLAGARELFAWDEPSPRRTLAADANRARWARSPDGGWGALLAGQIGEAAAVCEDARAFATSGRDGRPPLAIAPRIGARGPYRWVSDDDSLPAVGRFSGHVLKVWACYWMGGDANVLGFLPALEALVTEIAAEPTDPLAPLALERLADLADEEARRSGGERRTRSEEYRAMAARLRARPQAGQALWRSLLQDAQRGINNHFGRVPNGGGTNGTALAAAGRYVHALVAELFGVDESPEGIRVAPRLDGVADQHTWRLSGWRLAADTLSFSYRPADRAAELRLVALQRRRLLLGFPWLTAGSCVTMQRGPDAPERLLLVQRADGLFYVDVRGGFEPARVRVSAESCG